jgi:hypothetical protein
MVNPNPHGWGTERAIYFCAKIGTGCLKQIILKKYKMPHKMYLNNLFCLCLLTKSSFSMLS